MTATISPAPISREMPESALTLVLPSYTLVTFSRTSIAFLHNQE